MQRWAGESRLVPVSLGVRPLPGDDLDAPVDALVADVDVGPAISFLTWRWCLTQNEHVRVTVDFLAPAARLLNRIGFPSCSVLNLTVGGGRVAVVPGR